MLLQEEPRNRQKDDHHPGKDPSLDSPDLFLHVGFDLPHLGYHLDPRIGDLVTYILDLLEDPYRLILYGTSSVKISFTMSAPVHGKFTDSVFQVRYLRVDRPETREHFILYNAKHVLCSAAIVLVGGWGRQFSLR